MPTVDFTLADVKDLIETSHKQLKTELKTELKTDLKEDMDARFIAEREFTRQLVQQEVGELKDQFQSFIVDNFEPAMQAIDQRFDRVEDHLDHLDSDVAVLKTDTRHVKQALRSRNIVI